MTLAHHMKCNNIRTAVAATTRRALVLALWVGAAVPALRAQNVALKTNLLYWATTTPNIGAEFRLGQKHSLQAFYGLNPWKQSGGNHSTLRHWVVMPEWRYWFCQTFNGAFLGVHALGGQYRVGEVDLPFGMFPTLGERRYKGWYVGGGVTAGYQWPLTTHWSLEAALGVGYIYSPYDGCDHCNNKTKDGHRNYVGPTKAALSLVYFLNKKRLRRFDNSTAYLPTGRAMAPDSGQVLTPTTLRGADLQKVGVRLERADLALDGAGGATLALQLNLDSLYVGASRQLIYTPIIVSGGQETALPPIVINGRREDVLYRRGTFRNRIPQNATVVRRHNRKAQTIDYTAQVAAPADARNYDVRLVEDVCGCGDVENYNRYTLISRRAPIAAFVHPQAEGTKVRRLEGRAYIDFPVDRTELHPDYRRNPEQLDTIISTINALKADRDLEVQSINIHGYASPESPYEHNDMLARGRARTLTEFVQRMVSLPREIFTISSTPEDWAGLIAFLEKSHIAHKAELLTMARDESLAPDAREWRIKSTYPDEYAYMLREWYPALRHSDYVITYKVRPFNLEEARRLIKTRPQLLSEEEMFMVAQSYEPGSAEFNDVMETAVRLFPDNASANLNAACARLSAGDADGARPYLDKAGSSPQALNARGMYYSLKGEQESARTLYEQAARAGLQQAKENLRNLQQ